IATKLEDTPERSPLVQRLERIAKLRAGEGGIQALREAAFDDDPQVARYSLRRLLQLERIELPTDHILRLRQVRDNDLHHPRVRLLAGELLYSLEGKPLHSPEPYEWLRSLIQNSTQNEWIQIRPFVEKLIAVSGRRAETIDF